MITSKQKEAAIKLANILDVPPGLILQALLMLENKTAYWIGHIPKKSGGERQIQAARRPLNIIQARIAGIISQEFVSEINHGFVAGRSHRTAILTHLRANAFFTFDIKDAFPSTTRKQVQFGLRQVGWKIGFEKEVADLMAELVCYTPTGKIEDSFLPLGYTSSPHIFNLVLKDIDRLLLEFAKKRGYQVSRYVDNFAISTTEKTIPATERKTAIKIVESWSLRHYKIPEEKTSYWEVKEGKVLFEFLGLVIGETKDGKRVINVVDEKLGECQWIILGALEQEDFSEATIRTIRGKMNYLTSVYRGQGRPLPAKISELFARYKAMKDSQFLFETDQA